MKPILVLTLIVVSTASFNASSNGNPILTCFTNPCLQVEGVGKIMGSTKKSAVTGRDIYSYYSLRYGKETSGDLRFAPPQPAEPLNDGSYRYDGTYGTYLLSWQNQLCPQAGANIRDSIYDLMADVAADEELNERQRKVFEKQKEYQHSKAMMGTEDCLNLAVFTPRSPKEIENGAPLLPVMFFIHGGAFYMGTYMGMGPKALLDHDVVLVEINYRLGPLGFMCTDHPEAAGNMGLMDQALALDWVRDHIQDFGGNPDEITIFGESAGAASVSYHMLSPMTMNKFQRAIAQSGSALVGWAFDNEPAEHARKMAKKLGCPSEELDELVQCMKYEKSAQDIVNVHSEYINEQRYNGTMGFGGTSPCAQTNGAVQYLTKHPEEVLKKKEFEPKPIIFGANKHEGSFVLGVMYNSYIKPHGYKDDKDWLMHDFITDMLNALGLHDSSGVVFEILEHEYFNYTDLGDWNNMMPGMVNLIGAFFIKAGTYEFMKYNSMIGGESHLYSFEYEGEHSAFDLLYGVAGSEPPPIPHGVTHFDELIYLFTTGLFELNGDDLKVSQDMAFTWANFAINGVFETRAHDIIPSWTEDSPKYLKIDLENSILENYIDTWKNPDRNPICPK